MAVGYVVSLAFFAGMMVGYFAFRTEKRDVVLMWLSITFVFALTIVAFIHPQHFNAAQPKPTFDTKPASEMAKDMWDKAADSWKKWKW